MRKHTIIAAGLLIFLSTVSLSGSPPAEELGKWWKNSGIVKELDLSDSQIEQIERRYMDHRVKLADLVERLKTCEDRLKSLMKEMPMNESGILKQTELVAGTRKDLEIARTAMMLSMLKELDPEQGKKLQEMREFNGSPMISESPGIDASGVSGREKPYVAGANGVRAPVSIYMPMPSYTREARAARVEGIVLLQAVIRKDGSIDSFKVLRGLGYGLDESAIDTITKEWRLQPGTLNDRPVDVQVVIEVSFRLY